VGTAPILQPGTLHAVLRGAMWSLRYQIRVDTYAFGCLIEEKDGLLWNDPLDASFAKGIKGDST
jgi:hypothetical protein